MDMDQWILSLWKKCTVGKSQLNPSLGGDLRPNVPQRSPSLKWK